MKSFFKDRLPSPEELKSNRFLRLLGPSLTHPGVWRLTRRSVAGGVAAGMFCGLMPPPFQFLSAGVLAVLLRVNLPIALFTTLYTNPLTAIPIYLVCLEMGIVLFRLFELPLANADAQGHLSPPPPFDFTAPLDSLGALAGWLIGLGWPLVLGVVVVGMLLSLLSYAVVYWGWAWRASRQRERRARSRQDSILLSEFDSTKDRSQR